MYQYLLLHSYLPSPAPIVQPDAIHQSIPPPSLLFYLWIRYMQGVWWVGLGARISEAGQHTMVEAESKKPLQKPGC